MKAILKRAARLLCLNLGGFAFGCFGFKLAEKHPAAVIPFLAGFVVTAAASFCSYFLGRGLLLRQIREAGALRPPAPPSLEAVPDGALFVEFMARAYRTALHEGDERQLAHIRHIAEHVPPLQARLEALSAEGPRINSTTRGQA